MISKSYNNKFQLIIIIIILNGIGFLVVTIWLELCTTYSSSCHHHYHHP